MFLRAVHQMTSPVYWLGYARGMSVWITRFVALALVAGGPVSALAEVPKGETAVRLGFYTSDRFTYAPTGQRKTLEGPQIGLDWPLSVSRSGDQILRLSPTVVFGGAGRKGGDLDAMIYRLMVTARLRTANKPFFTVVGAGVGITQGRDGTTFSKAARLTGYLGLGYDLGRANAASIPFVQLGYQICQKQSRGWQLEAGVRF